MNPAASFALLLLSLCCRCKAVCLLTKTNHRAAYPPELMVYSEKQAALKKSSRRVLQVESLDEMLMEAVERGNYSQVGKFLDEGANPNYTTEKGADVLGVAIARDFGSIVTLLVNNGADSGGASGSGTKKFGSLQFSALFDAANAAEALLGVGVPIDGLNSFGDAALHLAAFKGSIGAATFLLDNGAMVDVLSHVPTGGTPLHNAVIFGHLPMVRLLLSRGADVGAWSNNYDTPLHDAAQANSGRIVQELIASGAGVDVGDHRGRTPLFDAAVLGNEDAIDVLVMNGADKDKKAFGSAPREALCACLAFDKALEECKRGACENPNRMQQLLV